MTPIFEFSKDDCPRLNISVIGIGDWGCSVLDSIVQDGLSYALTLALPTSDYYSYCRHSAARALPLYDNNHYDDASRVLENSDLNIFLISCKAHADIEAGYNFINTIALTKYDKYIVITDCKAEPPTNLHQQPTIQPLSTLYLDAADELSSNILISTYIRTLLNIIYNHRLKGIEYFEPFTFTGDDKYRLASCQTFDVDPNQLHNIPTQLNKSKSPETRRSIVCIDYSGSFNPTVVNGDICEKYPVPALVCFVPTNKCMFHVTALNFE